MLYVRLKEDHSEVNGIELEVKGGAKNSFEFHTIEMQASEDGKKQVPITHSEKVKRARKFLDCTSMIY